MHPPCLTILLGTYNGGDYLPALLASLRDQDYPHWRLLIRDDGSDDGTPALLDRWSGDRRIEWLRDDLGRRGAVGNFARLLAAAAAGPGDYFLFADQDDAWCDDKLSRLLEVARVLERRHPDAPLLVHSDLEVVDQNLRPLAPSFMAFQGIRHVDREPLRVLLAQNFVTGCSCLFNRRLLELATPVPPEAQMHDWWLALLAAAVGRIGFVDRPLVRYRQHAGNQVGAKRLVRELNPLRGGWRGRLAAKRRHFNGTFTQARALSGRLRERGLLTPSLARRIDGYAGLMTQRRLSRLSAAAALRIRRLGWARQGLFLASLLLAPGREAP